MKRLFVSVVRRALIRDLFVAQLHLHEFLGEFDDNSVLLAVTGGTDCPHNVDSSTQLVFLFNVKSGIEISVDHPDK